MESVTVNIFDTDYVLRGENPDQIRDIAIRVDRLMREIAKQKTGRSPVSIAVLAALTFAESLSNLERKATEPEAYFDQELNRMIEMVDGLLK